MIIFRTFVLDLYIFFCFFTILTGGFFLPDQVVGLFGSHPKAYRLPLQLMSVSAIFAIAFLHLRDLLLPNSLIARSVSKIKLKGMVIVFFIFATLALIYSLSSVARHHAFQSSFDFAIFAQAIWNTWHGDFLYSSIKGGICILGDHVSPTLALFAPLYGVWDDPSVLLVAQAVIATSTVVPLYLIARKVLNNDRLALLFPIVFALYTPHRNAVRFDFHPELMGDPLILWAFYFILKNKLRVASVFLFSVLMTKEVACGPVAMLGLYTWWFQKKKFFGIAWFLIAVAYLFLAVKVIAPSISGWDYAYLSSNYVKWQEKGIAAFLQHLFQGSTFAYFKKVFLPLGFFSFLSPSTLLLTAPTLAQNLIAPGPLPRSTFFQYTTFLTPFAFVSAIFGFRNVLKWIDRQKKLLSPRMLTLVSVYWLIGASIFMMGGSEIRTLLSTRMLNNDHFSYVRQYIQAFPSEGSVRTHEFFAPHFAKRKEVHIYENGHPREGGSERAQNAKYVVIDEQFLKSPIANDLEILSVRGYKVIHQHEGFHVLRK